MWTAFLVVYAAGLAVTLLAVFRKRVMNEGYVMEAAWAVLWPVYWGVFLTSFLVNRTPGSPRRPSK